LDFNSLDISENSRVLTQLGLKYFLADPEPPKPKKTSSPSTPNDQNASFILPKNIKLKLSKLLRPAYTLWIYAGFTYDLSIEEVTDRKQLIRSIVHQVHDKLNWPQGSITFWPVFNFKNDNLAPDIQLFQYGLEQIKPIYIFCFGKDAFKTLFPDQDFEIKKFYYGSYLVQALPDFDQLLPDNRELKNLVWQTLKKYTPQ
jgi:hypothetical protein